MSLQGWYPLVLARDIAPGTSAGTRVEGKEFVAWRDDKGASHVWEDRCPHRGMKMSFGFVRGDHIACLYHGWQYDTAGQCRHIPAHPDLDVPKTIKIATFGVAEAGGMVWCNFDTEADNTAPPPDLSSDITPLRTVFADCQAALLVERIPLTLLDGITPDTKATAERVIEIRLGDLTMIAGIQPVAEREAALHIVAAGTASADQLKRLALWAEQLRRDAEEAATNEKIAGIAA